MIVFLDGRLVAEEAARISPADRGFTLGDGLFETLRATAGTIHRLPAHLARLRHGAEVLGLPLPSLDWADALARTLAANGLTDAVLRLTVSRGAGPRGVLPPADPIPTVLIGAAPLPAPAPPARLIIATATRRNEHSPLCGIKSLNYLDNIIARQEAAQRGADDALLLNTAGRVAESTIANVFAVLDGALVTPPLAEGALPGVMRAAVLAEGAVERPLTPQDLERAQEIFLTSSLGIRSVAGLGGRTLEARFPTAQALRDRIGA